MYYPLSQLVSKKKNRFHGIRLSFFEDKGYFLEKPIGISTNNNKNNFGPILNSLPTIFPYLYSNDKNLPLIISNNNREDFLAWYLDGSENFTVKKNLPSFSSYAILEDTESPSDLWISKPSHPYVGSGDLIKIGKKRDLQNRKTEFYKNHHISSWVLQPLISDIIYWQNVKKFDIRFHVVFYTLHQKINVLMYKYGMGRKCVDDYDPINNYTSAITNISFQRKIYGYDEELNIFLVEDDIGCLKNLVTDLLKKSSSFLKPDPEKKHQLLLLGFDVMLSSKGKPILIEINTDPILEVDAKNNLGIFTLGTLLGIFGYLIPSLSEERDVNMLHLKDWEKIEIN